MNAMKKAHIIYIQISCLSLEPKEILSATICLVQDECIGHCYLQPMDDQLAIPLDGLTAGAVWL